MRRTLRVGRWLVSLLVVAFVGSALDARALDLNRRFTVGFRVGDYLPADEQKGGFRTFGAGVAAGPGEHAVQIGEVPVPTFSFAYGVAKFGRVQLSLELEASRFESEVGRETAFHDRNASTRVALPVDTIGTLRRGADGDEEFLGIELGDVTMTPISVNALFHWTRDGGRADFYAGMGLGVMLADFELSDEYVDFAGDHDGVADVQVDDAFLTTIKLGSNVQLSRNKGWLLYFEAEFLSTSLFTSDSQITWSGVDYFADLQDVDFDGDNVPDARGWNSDYRVMDPGHIRMDGAVVGVGLKYRFGGRRAAQASEAASEEAPEQ